MAMIEKGAVIGARYRLVGPLARGGMGAVWVARHLSLDVDVAVKLMAPELVSSPDARARFESEAKASASLRIANAVHVYDYGIEDDTPYLAMELLDGEDLETRLQREARLSKAATLTLVIQVTKVLRRAHELGLVHRDLKPANLFLARQKGEEEETLKVLDFGIAKKIGLGVAGSTTKTGTLLGSPLYMSPEQIRRSKEVDHRSDLWSLGVILFECLTGRQPFQGVDLAELVMAICTEELSLASSIAPELGPEVDGFFARALAREPADRFQSADDLTAAFAQAMSAVVAPRTPTLPLPRPPPEARGGTLSPHGTSLVEPPARGSRIRQAILAGAIALVLLAALVLALSRSDGSAPPPGPVGSSLPATSLSAVAVATAPPLPTATSTVSPPAPTEAVPQPGATAAPLPPGLPPGPKAAPRPVGPRRPIPSAPPASAPQSPGGKHSHDNDPTRHI